MRSTRFSTRRSTLRGFAALAAMALSATFSGNTQAAGYPERPIELIVPWGPGGGADHRLDEIDQAVARIDIDARIRVSEPVFAVDHAQIPV